MLFKGLKTSEYAVRFFEIASFVIEKGKPSATVLDKLAALLTAEQPAISDAICHRSQ